MTILNGIQNLLQFLNNCWPAIVIIIGLAITLFEKIKNYLNTTKEEKIAIAEAQIQETVLQLITEAELEWDEWEHTGSIKRAQVISQIYESYPILSKIVDQDTLIEWIDEVIDEALETLRSIIANDSIDISEDSENGETDIIEDSEEDVTEVADETEA